MTEIETPTMATEPAATQQAEPKQNKAAILLNRVALVLSFVGIFVAGLLSLTHAMALSIPCGDNGGCDVVNGSSASLLFGIPVAYLGLAAYTTLAGITILRGVFGVANTKLLGLSALIVSGGGALFSAYLQYTAYAQIKAFCPWCFTSAVTMCIMFLVQASLAQMEIEPAPGARRDSDVALIVALGCITVIALGAESTSLIHRAPALIQMKGDKIGQEMLTPDSMRQGPDSAPLKIVEFSDLLCPSCRTMFPKVEKFVKDSNGQAQLIWRNFPLIHNPEHKMSLSAAYMCEYAADRGKGWQFVDAIYKVDTDQLQNIDQVYGVAKSIGLDVADIKAHMKPTDPDYMRVMRDYNLAKGSGFDYTPTFVILAPGIKPVASMAPDLEGDLKQPQYQQFLKGHAN